MTTSEHGAPDRRLQLALALALVAFMVVAQLSIAALLAMLDAERVPPRLAALLGQVGGILLPALLLLPLARRGASPPRRLDIVGGLAVATAIPLAWITGAASQAATIAGLQRAGWAGLEAARERVMDAYSRVLSFDSPVDAALTVLLVCALAPIVEELAFRGVLQPLLNRAAGPIVGIAATAFVFAALHLEPLGLVPRFLLGLGSGVLAHRLGSLRASVALHAGFNGISLALVAAVGSPTALGIRPMPDAALVPALVIGALAATAFLGLLSLVPLGERRPGEPEGARPEAA